ncbi:MAG: hypoxanthine phosphoribosyltransferase [Dehalococcoidia bacterium]|nr:hypoxanthine phosphoribosyltransferase [Dehalococcoidia bacterium]
MDRPHVIKPLISRGRIAATVRRLARQISTDYQGKDTVIVGILTGSFVFVSDLIRRLTVPVEVQFVQLSSYGSSTCSSGKVTMKKGLDIPVSGRHVLVVEDIIDTGLTMSYVLDFLRRESPASLKVCALADKPSRRQTPLEIDYLGFSVPDVFIVGYGLDWGNKYRHLPEIYYIKFEDS